MSNKIFAGVSRQLQQGVSRQLQQKGTDCRLLSVVLLVVSGFAGKLAAQETVTQFFSRAEAVYQGLADYKALWNMEIDGQNSVATAYYKAPGKVLLAYSSPRSRFILINEQQLVIYNRQNNILMTQPLQEATAGPPSLQVMRRLYSMRYKYDTGSQPVREEGIENPVIVLLLSPINSSARLEELQVSFYADTLLLRQIAGSWYGSKVVYDFLNIETNTSLADSIFQLQEPPGAKEWANFLQD